MFFAFNVEAKGGAVFIVENDGWGRLG